MKSMRNKTLYDTTRCRNESTLMNLLGRVTAEDLQTCRLVYVMKPKIKRTDEER